MARESRQTGKCLVGGRVKNSTPGHIQDLLLKNLFGAIDHDGIHARAVNKLRWCVCFAEAASMATRLTAIQ